MKLQKVIIVDDEIWIAKSLAELLDWNKEGYSVEGVFTDSTKALDCIRESEPELILLDIRMPTISGERIMEIIQEEGIRSKVIIISAYSDFSVAQKAIACGAAGYILKPIDAEQLLLYVRRIAADKIGNETPIDPMDTEKVLSIAFNDADFFADNDASYAVALSSPIGKADMFSKTNIKHTAPVTLQGNMCLFIVKRLQGESIDWMELQKSTLNTAHSFGISDFTFKLSEEYPTLYQQALCARYNTILKERDGCYFYHPPNPDFVRLWMLRLTDAFLLRDKDKIQSELGEFFLKWKVEGNPATLCLLTIQLSCRVFLEIDRNAQERDPMQSEETAVGFLHFQNFFSAFLGISEIHAYLYEVLNSWDSQTTRGFLMAPKTVVNIKQYIDKNYAEDLNLNHISQQFFLTPSYISDIFKRSTGYTITGYILKIRMAAAAELLLSSTMGLVEVADMVGYDDYNYFCRLFKRCFSVTPNTYRRVNQTSLIP